MFCTRFIKNENKINGYFGFYGFLSLELQIK